MNKIVMIDSDREMAGKLISHLDGLGYQSTYFDDGIAAKEYLTSNICDLLLIDIVLPHHDGLNLCVELRQQFPYLPIIIITTLDSEADIVVGLEFGADDYLLKPFSFRICQARIKALLRRCQLYASKESKNNIQKYPDIHFDELHIDRNARSVLLHNQAVNLTAREFDLLLFLAQNKRIVFSRNQLLDSVWGYTHGGSENTINTHVNRLRRKLHRENKPDFIQTVWAVGYKFLDEA